MSSSPKRKIYIIIGQNVYLELIDNVASLPRFFIIRVRK